MEPLEIVKRVERLTADRSALINTWADIQRYIAPLGAGEFYNLLQPESGHNWTTREVWDSTAVIGAERMAAAFYAGTVNNYQRWFRNAFPIPKLNQNQKARTWLDQTSDRMFNALVASNFGLETASGFRDLTSFGTTAIFQELANPKKWEGFQFAATPIREILFEEDWRGRALRWYHVLSWDALQIISKFCPDPLDPAQRRLVPDCVWKAEESASGEKFKVIFFIGPRDDIEPMRAGERARSKENRPFEACYVLDKTKERLGEEDGYYEMPAYVIRFLKSPGSRWGYGPGQLALPTVKFLNAWMEAYLGSAEKVVDPAFIVTERGLLSDPDLGPGGQTTVRSLDDIKPWESTARFDVAAQIINDLRDMVRRFFREDDLQLKDSPAMTATEAQIREARTNRVLASPVGRVQNDYFDPMLQNTFSMMYREQVLEPPPPQVIEELAKANVEIMVEYLGPLMRSQRADDVAALERLASGVAALKKMGFEEVSDVFNAQQVVREMAEFLSTPGTCIRDQADADKIKSNREQMQQAMAQAQIQKTAAEANRAQAGAQEMMNGPTA